MPEILFTTDRRPIEAVRVVPASQSFTASGHPVRAVRAYSGTGLITPAGYPVAAVRLVDAAGAYTTSQAPITTQPEDVFTPEGSPIAAVRLLGGAEDPYANDGLPVEAVRLVDAAGAGLAALSDADATAWRDAVVLNGGTVTAGELALATSFVVAEKAAGTWPLTDDYWPIWQSTPIAALTSLKQRRLMTALNGPTFVPNSSFLLNGTSQYLDTGFVCATHAVAMTTSNVRMAAYEMADVIGNTFAAGINGGSNRILRLQPRVNVNVTRADFNSAGATNFTLPIDTSVGFTAASRNADAGASAFMFKNGVPLAQAVGPTTFPLSLPAFSIFIGCYSLNGTPSTFGVRQVGFLCVGAPLSPAQEVAQNANVQAWRASLPG